MSLSAMTKIMFLLLAIVGASAFILSFAGLRDLALSAGYSANLAVLVPIVIDAGAAAALLAWRTGWAPAVIAMRACLVLMGSSVALNVVQHLIAANGVQTGWWLTVSVVAIPPAVLGLIFHALAQAPARPVPIRAVATVVDQPGDEADQPGDQPGDDLARRAAEIAANGGGRGTVKRELGLESEHQARKLLERARELATTNGQMT